MKFRKKGTVPEGNNCGVSDSELGWVSRFLPFRGGGMVVVLGG